jgi:DNA-binding Lrp family transcriptional regulator
MEVDKVLQLLSAKFGSSLAEVRIATCLNYSIFPPKYLAPSKPVLRSEVTVTHNGFDRSLDDKDHSLLRCLAELPDASFRDQSRTLGWASSTFDARLKALTSCGVFNGYIWLIHPGMYGHESFRIYIALRSISAQVKQAIYQFSHTHPYVTYHIEWLGDWHLCLGAIAPHVGEACRLVNEIHDRFGQFLARVTLVPILADHKIQIAPTKH